MKTPLSLRFTISTVALAATFLSSGCAGPAARHYARVDRRQDAVDRAGNRIDNRQANRWDRRYDRQERIENRYYY